jgi:predicted PurR-regulated permease PerM
MPTAGSKRSRSPGLSSLREVQTEARGAAVATLPLHARGRMIARSVFATLVVLLALWIARDFLAALAWGSVIAITTWPAYRRFTGLISDQHASVLAPLLFTVFTGFVLLLPLVLALHKITQESDALLAWLARSRETGIPVPDWIAQLPMVGTEAVRWWTSNLADPQVASAWLGGVNLESMTTWTGTLGGEVLHRVLLLLIVLITLFFLLRDGAWIGERVLGTADRLLGDPGERLASKMVDAVRGTVMGTVVVAVTEGVLIGVGYLVAGIPNPLLFTILTIAFAMLPLGAWLAFTAATLLLILQGGSLVTGAAIFGWGAAVMLVGDYWLWPMLVGNGARLPFFLALIGIFGGLHAFGLIGLFVGPVIMAAVLMIWREWLRPQDPR